MVLKYFNLPCGQSPQETLEKKEYGGKWTCLEIVLWRNSHLGCLELNSSVHRSSIAAARSPLKHFIDTPAVQFGRIRLGNRNQQQWHNLAETARPQPRHKSAGGTRTNRKARSSWLCLFQGREDQWRQETKKHCTASSISKPSSASITVHWVLFISSRHHVPSMGLALAQASVSADITLPISWNLKKWQETAAHHQKGF